LPAGHPSGRSRPSSGSPCPTRPGCPGIACGRGCVWPPRGRCGAAAPGRC